MEFILIIMLVSLRNPLLWIVGIGSFVLLKKRPKKIVYLAAMALAVPVTVASQYLIGWGETDMFFILFHMIDLVLIVSICYFVRYLWRVNSQGSPG